MTGERFITQNVHAKMQDCGQFFQKMRDAIPHGTPAAGVGSRLCPPAHALMICHSLACGIDKTNKHLILIKQNKKEQLI